MSVWEVRTDPNDGWYSVERGTTRDGDLVVAATGISDYGLAEVIEAVLNFRDGLGL